MPNEYKQLKNKNKNTVKSQVIGMTKAVDSKAIWVSQNMIKRDLLI